MRLEGLSDVLASVEADSSLELPFGGRTYTVRPPTAARGLRCATYLAARQIEDEAERAEVRMQALDGGTLADLALGEEALAEMSDLSGPVLHQLAWVALVAWVNGEAAANRYVAAVAEQRAGTAEAEATPPKARARRSPKRSGTSTASARKTPTRASGPAGTESRPS
ncbi:hypothetical protein ACFS27_03395 [Promicromonospora vindobonensis]|uniref:DUF7426 domain-containing protein n=1 Tax=Promicromonospora vindobonensis TaxID=195748 RepID=A0ABW5VMQ2_9MICO